MAGDEEADSISYLAPLISALRSRPESSRYYLDLLGPLQAYDQEHFGDLTRTLSAYLHHARNATRTADALYIHRNSLRYRLERIKMLVSLDPDDANEGLALQIALLLVIQPER